MRFRTGVQLPSAPPKLDTNFDTMRIMIGVQFLFEEVTIFKAFHIHFNDKRLYGNQ